MYKWRINIILKGSGKLRECMYIGDESSSSDVIRKLFHGKQPNDWVDLYGYNETIQTFVTVGEIASVDIRKKGIKKDD